MWLSSLGVMTMSDLNWRVSELERRMANLVRIGTIVEADYAAARVRVASGTLVSGWLPWLTHRAGQDVTWSAPDIGEQVLVVSADGDTTRGVVIPALYRDAAPPTADVPTIARSVAADGAVQSHDRQAHVWLLDLTACAGTVHIRSGPSEIVLSPAGIQLVGPRIDLN
jgi:phage baseplate assembly protein V